VQTFIDDIEVDVVPLDVNNVLFRNSPICI
jgi:hypothetical protein